MVCAAAMWTQSIITLLQNEKRLTLEQTAQNVATQNSGAIAGAGARYAANNPQVVASAVSSGGSKSQSSSTFV